MADDPEIPILPVLETGTTIDVTGAQLPTVVVDATGHPHVADLARVHAVEGIGDIVTEATAVPVDAASGSWRFFLAVIIRSPVRCSFVLEFALPDDRRVLDDAAGVGHLVIATTPPALAAVEQPLWLAIDVDPGLLADALPK